MIIYFIKGIHQILFQEGFPPPLCRDLQGICAVKLFAILTVFHSDMASSIFLLCSFSSVECFNHFIMFRVPL